MSSKVPRLPLSRLPRIASQQVLAGVYTSRTGRRRFLWLAAAALALLAVAMTLLALLRRTPHYVLVIDAGSSGTRMHAYTWRDGAGAGGAPLLAAVPSSAAPHKVPRRALPSKRAYQRVETEPGLDAFLGDDGTRLQAQALGPLLEWAEAVVPPRRWRHTPVFLCGTAGLRKLSNDQQEELLEGVRQVLGQSSFRFQPPWARIISGTDEGVYGWIALNYLAGTLQRGGDQGSPLVSDSGGTLGALDLGGSSLEVTFAADSVPWEEDAVNATLLGASHLLYAHVHHHYGLNDAFDRSVDILLARLAPGGDGSSAHGEEKGSKSGDLGSSEEALPRGKAGSKGSTVDGLSAAEKAGVVAVKAGAKADAAGSDVPKHATTAGGGKQPRLLLQAPAALRHRLLLTAGPPQDAHSERWVGQEGSVEGAAAAGAGLSEEEAQRRGRHLHAVPAVPTVAHPCMHAGYSQQYKRLQVEGAGVPDPPQVLLVGSSDFPACQQLAQAVVHARAPCSAPPCALGTPQPATAGHRFVALAGFYVVYHFFRLPPNASVDALEQEGQHFCGKSWQQVQQERPGELMVEDYCFRAPYVAALLRQGLLLEEDQLEIGTGDIGWTLGAALAEGYRLADLGHGGSDDGVQLSWAPGGSLLGMVWLLGAASSAALLLCAAVVRWQRWRRPGAGWGAASSLGWLMGHNGLRKLHSKGSAEMLPIASPGGSHDSGRSSLAGLEYPVGAAGTSRTGTPLPTMRSARWQGSSGAVEQHPASATAAAAAAVLDFGGSSGGAGGSIMGRLRNQSWSQLSLPPADAAAAAAAAVFPADSSYSSGRLRMSRTFSRRSLSTSPEGGGGGGED